MRTASLSTDVSGNVLVVLRGDIDFTTSPGALQAIRAGAGTVPKADIRVDMSEVEFIDSSGIGVLVQLLNLAEEWGVHLHLEQPGRKVLDQLHLAGLTEVLDLPAPPHPW